MGIETVIAAVAAAAALAQAGASLAGSQRGPSGELPPIAPPAAPPGPAKDLDRGQILGQTPGQLNLAAPNWAGINDDMTSLQKRSKIAAFGTSGDSRYADSSIRDLYKNLALADYKAGSYNPLDVEYQYAENVLGAKPRARTAESLISAILRG